MTRRRGLRSIGAGTALVLLAGCTAQPPPRHRDPAVPPGQFQLVAFDSCADALAGLKAAARESVGPGGFAGGSGQAIADQGAALAKGAPAGGAEAPADAAAGAAPGYSGTNTHEVGVDEPDLVKTDGRRIVTINRAVLRVVDPLTRRVTGQLDLAGGADDADRWAEANLLLHGDRALVLISGAAGPITFAPGGRRPQPQPAEEPAGPRLVLVDLAGAPKVLGTYRIDGGLVDARQVGALARVVIRSAPRLSFPPGDLPTAEQRTAANRQVIDKSSIESWLPRYSVTNGGRTTTGQVGCDRLSRPATYSGGSMVTMLSFDLGTSALSGGDPVTVAADGDTVYSNGERLYLANNPDWWGPRPGRAGGAPRPAAETTEIYQFDIARPGPPRYVTSAAVPGRLINQYALSEWSGHLRVATTSAQNRAGSQSSSAVYVLRADGRTLTETGRATGLGKGERIYAVRFLGDTGYVVTFRQTDPLYTLDLRDPAGPRVTGELKVTGYSAYLHPLDGGRLIGIGQEANGQGRTRGTQISLFDVRDPARPARLAQYHVAFDQSEAESDPHAFLYWPADRLLVVPVSGFSGPQRPVAARALRVDERGFTELGMIDHPAATGEENGYGEAGIRRSLVVDGVLWTVSAAGLKATSIASMQTLGWVPTT